jgi:putative membrane protein
MKTSITSTLRVTAFLLAGSFAAALPAQAADPDPVTPTSSPSQPSVPTPVTPDPATQVKHHDRGFLEKAARAGMQEVMISQSVMGTLVNPAVRDLANMMVTDHTALDKDLRALALSKGVVLEDWDAKKNAKLSEKWSEKSGDVDKKYLHQMIEDHEDAVKLFEKAAKSDDADIAAFAQKTLPALMHHLSMAKDLKKSLDM